MIYSALYAEIQAESNVQNDSDWPDSLLPAIVYETLLDMASLYKDNFFHIYRGRVLHTDTSPDTFGYKLPVDFLKVDRVEFRMVAGVAIWDLPVRDEIVGPPLVTGKPKCYDIGSPDFPDQSVIYLQPQYTLLTGEIIWVSYWRRPSVPDSGDDVYPEHWIPELKKRSIQRVHVYHMANSNERAVMFEKLMQLTQQGIASDSVVKSQTVKPNDSPRPA